MGRISLTVHPDDDVATLLDFQLELTTTQDGLDLVSPIPFGHKVARSNRAGQAKNLTVRTGHMVYTHRAR